MDPVLPVLDISGLPVYTVQCADSPRGLYRLAGDPMNRSKAICVCRAPAMAVTLVQ
jgi:hypothetical protein